MKLLYSIIIIILSFIILYHLTLAVLNIGLSILLFIFDDIDEITEEEYYE